MRKIIHIFLSLVIVYASTTSAYANTSVGGWSALDVITAGATNTINATKTAGGKVLNSAITIAPQAGKVGKHLIKGGGTAALLIAVPQLLGDGVDWVLDPANNSVRYTEVADVDDGVTPASPQMFCKWHDECAADVYNYGNATAAAHATCNGYKETFLKIREQPPYTSGQYLTVECKRTNGSIDLWNVRVKPNPAYDPNYKPDAPTEKHLPINTVAAQVISNAEAGDPSSQEAVKATALEGFAAGEHDAALDAAATETGTENPPDTENPPKDPDAPAEPFDPAGIISAINALKALLAGILSSITGLADIFNSDPPPEKTQKETDVPVDDLPPTKGASDFDVNYINFGGQCPVLPSFDVGIGGASSTLTFDMTPLCDMAVKIRPAVIAIAYFIGLGVIASAIRET